MIWVNGNPALAKAVTGFGKKQSYQFIRRASRVLSNLFTTYSLDFSIKNLIRDTLYSRVALMVKEDREYRKAYTEMTQDPLIQAFVQETMGPIYRSKQEEMRI